jgi:hypothetical protein
VATFSLRKTTKTRQAYGETDFLAAKMKKMVVQDFIGGIIRKSKIFL